MCDLLTKHSTDTCLKEKLPSPITFSDHQILDITKIVNNDKLEKPNILNDDIVNNLKIEAGFMNDDPFTRAQKIEAQSRVYTPTQIKQTETTKQKPKQTNES